jgi:hypothetical protein
MLICPKEISGYNSTGNRVREMIPKRHNAEYIIMVVIGLFMEKLDKLIGYFH